MNVGLLARKPISSGVPFRTLVTNLYTAGKVDAAYDLGHIPASAPWNFWDYLRSTFSAACAINGTYASFTSTGGPVIGAGYATMTNPADTDTGLAYFRENGGSATLKEAGWLAVCVKPPTAGGNVNMLLSKSEYFASAWHMFPFAVTCDINSTDKISWSLDGGGDYAADRSFSSSNTTIANSWNLLVLRWWPTTGAGALNGAAAIDLNGVKTSLGTPRTTTFSVGPDGSGYPSFGGYPYLMCLGAALQAYSTGAFNHRFVGSLSELIVGKMGDYTMIPTDTEVNQLYAAFAAHT